VSLGAGGRQRWAAWGVVSGAGAIYAALAIAFLPHQSLWVDETTQMAGLRLETGAMIGWLAGHGPDLTVPPDRMPPGSYLVQSAWCAIVGGSEASLRWLSLVCSGLGIALTVRASILANGIRSGAVTGAFLATNCNLVVLGVEIRAYPLFVTWVGGGCLLLVRLLTVERHRALTYAALTLVLIGSCYTHYFGVVFSGAVLSVLLATARGRGDARFVVASMGAVAIACAGLLPFLRAAEGLSPDAPSRPLTETLFAFARVLYRLYGHPAVGSSTVATVAGAIGALALVVCIAAGVRRWNRTSLAFLGVLVAGLAAVAVASFVVRGFSATTPSYNVWAIPVAAIVLGGMFRPGMASWWNALSTTGLTAIVVASALGCAQLLRNPDAFTHGPAKHVDALVSRLGREDLALVYDTGSDALGHLFFPVRFVHGRDVAQYLVDDGGTVRPVDPGDPIPPGLDRRHVLVVRIRSTSASDLAQMLREPPPVARLPAADRIVDKGWHRVTAERRIAQATADLELLTRD
jgi:uncharacterized membrane protein